MRQFEMGLNLAVVSEVSEVDCINHYHIMLRWNEVVELVTWSRLGVLMFDLWCCLSWSNSRIPLHATTSSRPSLQWTVFRSPCQFMEAVRVAWKNAMLRNMPYFLTQIHQAHNLAYSLDKIISNLHFEESMRGVLPPNEGLIWPGELDSFFLPRGALIAEMCSCYR